MVDALHNVMDTTRRRITAGYYIALAAVAIAVITVMLISRHLMVAQIEEAAIINKAGRQRMLSQRIALFTQEVANSATDSQARHAALQKLKESIDEMEAGHLMLLEHVVGDSGRLGIHRSPEGIYFSPPLNLDRRTREFIADARQLLKMPATDINSYDPDVKALTTVAGGPLLDALEAAADHFQRETGERFHSLEAVIIWLCVAALVMLAVIALVVFRPAIAFVEQAQRRLVELNQLKGDFLANMSHEIRTPMNGIFGMAELLLDSDLNQRQQHYARTLQNSADHLLGLINDILDFSKLEAGQMKLDPIRFNLLSTIEDVMELLASRAREKNLELLLRYAPGTPRFIVADPGRIRQLLFNLIGNAVKFTDQGYVMTHVEVLGAENAPDQHIWLKVRVEDTGIGIPEDKIGGLFEKFMQVESGSTRAQQGTGLGLAICRNLVHLMGGEISVQSQPGKGTVFTWQIPLKEASDPMHSADRQATLEGKRVLLVDDLAPNRALFKEALTTAGMECMVAENAEEAFTMLTYQHDNGAPFDIVVTDYMMPVADGIKLTQAIKGDSRFSAVPVVILSSAGEHGLIKRFGEAGAAACLAKPVTRQQLFDTLSHVLSATARGESNDMITAENNLSMSARHLLAREHPFFGTRLLLVEDNRVNMEITTEMLNQLGCEVTTASNGHEAIEAARRQMFDLIFMDCQMPVMDGFEAARHIVALKQKGEIAAVPIVALTANALKGDRERCLESGMDDYLSKPVRKANLQATLLKWLQHRVAAHGTEPAPPVPKDTSAPATAGSAPQGIDMEAFANAREMLGAKFPTILSYYLEDAESFINRIAESVARHDVASAVTPAHTLKSSSRQLGVTALADLGARAEATARANDPIHALSELERLLPDMKEALAQARPFFISSGAA